MEKQLFSPEELHCLKAAVNYCIAMQDLWNCEYVISDSKDILQESDLLTLDKLKLKLESA